MKRQALIPAIIVALGVGGYFFYRHNASGGAGAELFGNVDIREAMLAFRVSGRVADIMVDEGDTVREGDVLAVLDAEPLENAAEAAMAALSSISARNARS